MLALPELTNDMSDSGTDSSPYDLPLPLLVKGDLFFFFLSFIHGVLVSKAMSFQDQNKRENVPEGI